MKKKENLTPSIESRFKIAISNSHSPDNSGELFRVKYKKIVDDFTKTGVIDLDLIWFMECALSYTSMQWLLKGEGEQESRAHFYKGLHDDSRKREEGLIEIIDMLNTELESYQNGGNSKRKPANFEKGKIIKMNIR